MKSFYKLSGILFFVLATFTNCEKDIVVIDAFNFEVEENHDEVATINYPQQTTLSIVEEKPLERDNYFFSYTMVEGQGAYIFNGSPVSPNEYIELENPEEQLNLNFVSSSLGVKKVRIEINNNGKVIKEIDLVYDVRHNPYTLSMTSPVVDYEENDVIPIKVDLENTGVDNSVVYERAFFLLEGEGQLFRVGDTEATPLEQYQAISEGESSYSLILSSLGTVKFLVRTRDSNNQIKEAILEFNGISQDLTFTVVTSPSDPSELFVNSPFRFDFFIPSRPGASDNKMSYVLDSGALQVSVGGTVIAQGDMVDVPTSGDFSWSGLSSVEQSLTITFTLESGGEQVTKQIELTFQLGSFNLDVIPDSIDANVNEEINITGTISPDAPNETYNVIVTSDKSGEITYNGTVVTLGTAFPVLLNADSEFVLTYKGLEQGEHNLSFKAENAAGDPSNVVLFTMNFTP